MMTLEKKRELMTAAGVFDLIGDAAVYVHDYLDRFGWMPSEDLSVGDVVDAITKFQDFSQLLKVDGVAGPKTLAVMQLPRCGCSDVQRLAGDPSKWTLRFREGEKVIYAFESYLPGLSQNDQRDGIQAAFDAWASVSGVDARSANSGERPHLIIGASGRRVDEFGQRGGVLAWCEMLGGLSRADSQLRMMFDTFEAWYYGVNKPGQNYLGTATHELGHFFGLPHGGKGLMQPFAIPGMNAPQKGYDIDEMRKGYGPPLEDAPAVVKETITITANYKGYVYKGDIARVND